MSSGSDKAFRCFVNCNFSRWCHFEFGMFMQLLSDSFYVTVGLNERDKRVYSFHLRFLSSVLTNWRTIWMQSSRHCCSSPLKAGNHLSIWLLFILVKCLMDCEIFWNHQWLNMQSNVQNDDFIASRNLFIAPFNLEWIFGVVKFYWMEASSSVVFQVLLNLMRKSDIHSSLAKIVVSLSLLYNMNHRFPISSVFAKADM